MGLMTTNESQARELRDESPTTPGSEYEDDKNESDLYSEYREAVGQLDNNVRFEEYDNEYHDEYDKANILQKRGELAETVELSEDDKYLQVLCWTIRHPPYAKYDELRSSRKILISKIFEYEATLVKMQDNLGQIELDVKRAYADCLEAGLITEDGLPNDETMLKASCKYY
ncbi:hypothetical protein VE03_10401 [Pseudogymnoascus sp. 23342-1-I1]|nr:hypothetical protein VE03_10401 [Pseudogymnoascus sp. 23342-1-I1]